MSKYPKPIEILYPKIKFKNSTLKIIQNWKNKYNPKKRKKHQIKKLIKSLTKSYNIKTKIKYIKNGFCYYNPVSQEININGKLSIVSALHETAHAIFGPNEYQACRWSVQLYLCIFPKNHIKWEKHQIKI